MTAGSQTKIWTSTSPTWPRRGRRIVYVVWCFTWPLQSSFL